MILTDTNILLRLLLKDDASQLNAVERYLDNSKRPEAELLVHPLMIAEVVWMLNAKGWTRAEAVDALLEFCAWERFKVIDEDAVKTALEFYLEGNVSFVDAFQAAYVTRRGFKGILSFDRDFDWLGVHRIDPKGK